MIRKIPQPSSGLICCLLALGTVLHLVTIIVTVTNTRQGVDQTEKSMEAKLKSLGAEEHARAEQLSEADSRIMDQLKGIEASVKDVRDSDVTARVKNLQTSVDRILSDEVIGSLSSDIQRLMIAVGRLSEGARKENASDSSCRMGWSRHGLSCYYKALFLRSWRGARKDCEQQGAHLVVINGEEEMTFLAGLTDEESFWIGLTDVDGDWKWVDGTAYETTPKFWKENQPDDWFGHGLGGGEDCAHLGIDGSWNDNHCSRRFPYICEKTIS